MKKTSLIILIITLFACSKYEEGPLLSLRTKKSRLTDKNWVLEKVNVDGQYFYEPDSLKLTCIIGQCRFASNGTYNIFHQVYDSVYSQAIVWTEHIGEWRFINRKKTISLNYFEIDYSDSSETMRELNKRILRLTNDELWFKVNINGCETIHYMKYN